MTKLISGRIKKTPSANVSASRYDFLKLSEAEPDLGLPAANGYILSGNVDGTRLWILPSTVAASASVANTVLSIGNFTTANLAEGSNLYYTNTRVYANVIGLLNTKSNVVDLTTANIVELTNLYYTNARVYANVIGLLDNKANVGDLTTSNVVEGNNLYYTNSRVYANVIGLLNNKSNVVDLTTANVVESASNLYFTVTRANVAIDNRVTKAFVETLGISSSSSAFAENANVANTVLSLGNFTTANLIEGANLYYTNARVYANVIGLLNSKANIDDLTTSNIAEGTNLYYTNARVYANVIGLLNAKANVVDLTTANVTESASNLYYTVARANAAIDARVTKEFIDTLGISGSSAVFAENANVANIVLSIGNFTTANLAEGTNLYYTNARVYANISPLLFNYQTLANAALKANVVDLTTSNVVEGTNLYYTNNRVYANVIGLLNTKANVADLTTSNVVEGTNLYYTNARVYANVVALLTNYTGNITAGNILANAIYGQSGGFITGANLISTNIISATTWTGLYAANIVGLNTANVAELTNLYYTNARVYANISPLLFNYQTLANAALKANVVDLTTANVTESTNNLYYTNARVLAGLVTSNLVVNDATILGNLYVEGDIVTLNAATLSIEDKNIVLANGAINSTAADGAGFNIDGAQANLKYRNTGDKFEFNKSLDVLGTLTATAVYSNTWNNLFTSNVIESTGNLYYTVARANLAIDNRVTKAFIDGLGISGSSAVFAENSNVANVVLSIGNFTTSNLAEGTNLYYTNARVNAQVESNLALKANVTDLTTANVIENTNLYYTNARVNAQVQANLSLKANVADLNTSNIIEGTNLYYTNTRVYANVIPLLNLKANVSDLTTSNVVEGDNLYYTNTRVYANVIPLLNLKANVADLNTSNIIEGTNLYYTNTRVYANVIGLLNEKANVVDLTTANVAELNNLYYTNTRVHANVIGLLNAKANVVDLTTSNVVEGTNLYYTNTRAYANLTAASINALSDVDTATYPPLLNQALMWDGTQWTPNTITISSAALVANIAIIAYNANIANVVLSIDNFTTSNLREGSNLYYTIERANAAIDSRVTKQFVDGLGINATTLDGVDSTSFALSTSLTTSNITEGTNLFYTNARVYANVIGLINNKIGADDLTTANVKELDGNLYYTNARVRTAISAGTGVIYDNSTGVISIGQNVDTLANVTFGQVNITGNLNVFGNVVGVYANSLIVNDSLIQFGYNNPSDSLDLGFIGHYNDSGTERRAGLFRDASDKKFKFFDNTTGDPSATTVDTVNPTFRLANVVATTFEGNVVGNVTGFVSSIGNFTTTDLAEGNNLYYTNARVYANVIGLLTNKVSTADLTTANVVELTNLYYTNSRVYSNVIGLLDIKANVSDLNTSNIVEGINLYYTNARVYANISPLLFNYQTLANAALKANVADLDTSNIVEGINLYYTNARVYANVIGLISNKVSVDDLTTANVKELSGNLYYTNERVYANISPLLFNYQTLANAALKANVADLTTSNVVEGTQLYYTNARVYANVIGLLNAKANVADLDTSNIVEGINLYYTNARVYANVIGLISNKVGTDDLTTANVKELAGNLYYTNARVYANISPLLFNYQTLANAALKANVADLTTSNVAEGTNLYYTNARVYSNVVALLQNYTGNITAGNIFANAIYGQSGGFITGANLISTNIISATTWTGLYAANIIGLTTANVSELTNLYYTNARVYANVIGLISNKVGTADLTTANVKELDGNLYYTNARVYANISPLLFNYQTLANAALKANVADLTTANVVELNNLYYTNARVHANVIDLLNAKANVSDLDTSNVVEGTNLYYTNARVYANVIGLLNNKIGVADLTTANVKELDGNLYYTNARVYSNVFSLLPNYTGNISASNITIGSGTDGSIVGANLISANYISATNWLGLYTANVIEAASGLYYTNARVYSNVIGLLDNYATAANLNLKANVVDLTTANVAELTNLYFTNARVLAGLVNSNLVVNDATILGNLYVEGDIVTLNTATLSIEDKNIVLANGAVNSTTADGAGFNIDGAQANLKYRNTGDKFEFNKSLDVIGTLTATAVYSNTWNNLFTSNVIEGANLYYTVARANAAIDARVTKEFIDTLGISGSSAVFAERSNIANLVLSISNFTTANLIEGANLYYTNARVYSNVISLLNAKANVVDLTTANVAELTNLYYTNVRVYANVIPLLDLKANVSDLNTNNVIEGTNLYYTNARVYANVISLLNAKANVADLNTSNVIEGTNLYYTNARVYANIIPLLDLKANLTELTTSNVAELTNLYYTNTRVYANVIPLLNLKANVVDLTTANVIESVNNLYYTNARVYANVSERLLQLDSNIIPATDELYDLGSPTHKFKDLYLSGFSITLGTTKLSSSDGGLLVNAITANIWNNLYTANVRETASNLYYTNARVYANVIPLLNLKANVVDLTTANVSELTNLYYTNARVYANVIPLLDLKANVSDLITSNVAEGNNLYYTNARVYANVISLLNAKANVVDLTTANVSELTNLYYTNARVYANVISLLNAKANVTDLTTSNVAEGSSLYYTNARVHSNVVALLPSVNVRIVSSFQQFVSDGTTTVYTLSTSVIDETSIFVIIDGLTQIPSLDYTASAVTLTLLTVPAFQSNVIVRYFSASLSL